ncbi:MAG: exodeoxyribonuclease III [Holosporales bacterium]|nr:exodeoxyribonuclease III [Holosporales bacterium]
MTQIATWNVNSIRMRLPLLMSWLEQRRPEIVLLQETKVEDKLFPAQPLEDLGYNTAFYGEKTYNGVAILSKFPLEEVQRGFPEEGASQQTRYLEAFTGGYRVASVYVPNGQEVGSEKYLQKKKFFEALYQRAELLLSYKERLILGGDYNVAPQDQDVYDPLTWREKILCSTPERQWFRSLLYLGFTDSLDARDPVEKNPYTWWDYRQNSFARNSGLRIDHLLLSPEATDCLEKVFVEKDQRSQEKTSDHAPVVGIFKT